MGDRMQEGVKPRRSRVHPPSLCVARIHFRRTILKLTCWVRGATSSTLGRKRAWPHQIGEQKQTNTERESLWGYGCPEPHHCCLAGLSANRKAWQVAGVLELTASLSPQDKLKEHINPKKRNSKKRNSNHTDGFEAMFDPKSGQNVGP